MEERNKHLIAGACALESREQGFKIAEFVKGCGATMIRFGCFKGQNHPIVNGKPAYWGLGNEGLKILAEIQEKLEIPCISEVQSKEQAGEAYRLGLRWFQVGARHQQNFPLLRYLEMFHGAKMVLKRGLGNTVDEWIGSAEHLGGPKKVILCERGICSFDRTPLTRWRLDFVGVAQVRHYHSDYQIIIDPSHGSGDKNLVEMLSKSALEIADGLMLEVHYDPPSSPTDANQTIDFDTFKRIADLWKKKQKSV